MYPVLKVFDAKLENNQVVLGLAEGFLVFSNKEKMNNFISFLKNNHLSVSYDKKYSFYEYVGMIDLNHDSIEKLVQEKGSFYTNVLKGDFIND